MKSYPAKILLFGEHTVNLGTSALAMPLCTLSSRWEQVNLPKERMREQQRQLPQLAQWLAQQGENLPFKIDVSAFEDALRAGWVLASNIPEGYGLGSSGSVVAAIVDRWGTDLPESLPVLRQGLAAIEGFFHGKSSGTDPLVSFLQVPVRISPGGVATLPAPLLSHSGLFVLDTGMRRSATPLIRKFLAAWEDAAFEKKCRDFLLPSVNEAIEKMIHAEWSALFTAFERISHFQLRHTPWLIPQAIQPLWQRLLREQSGALKICGAGGGGFILGMLPPGAALPQATNKWPVKFLKELV